MTEKIGKTGSSTAFFKNELKLDPKQLTLEYMKQQDALIKTKEQRLELEWNIRKAEYPVLVLGDNIEPGKPSPFLETLQKEIAKRGFLCAIGSHIYLIQTGRFEAEIEKDMMQNPNHPRQIILVSGKGFATIGESKLIRLKEDLNNKTLFFFDHEKNYEKLVLLAEKKQFPIEFKYPIPYTGEEELKAKILFGILHCFYRYLRYKRPKPCENNNN